MENKTEINTGNAAFGSQLQTAGVGSYDPDALSVGGASKLTASTPGGFVGGANTSAPLPNGFSRFVRRFVILVATILLIGGTVIFFFGSRASKNDEANSNAGVQASAVEIPLSALGQSNLGQAGDRNVTINGPLKLNDAFVLSPQAQPVQAAPGQMYYDQNTNELNYYNGTDFIALTAGLQSVTSANNLLTIANDGSGNITLTAATQNGTTGSGGTVTSSGGTAGRIAKFTDDQNIEDSLIAEAGTVITVNGDLTVTGSLGLGTPLTVANGGTGAATLAVNGVVVGNGTGALTSVTAGGTGQCLLSTAGAPAFAACPGGGGGVSSLNGQVGIVTLANASGSLGTVTIDNASTAAKGIAMFNSTNFSDNGSGTINTIQNINSTASPTFTAVNTNAITPSSTLTVGATGQALTLQGSGATKLTATSGGNTTTLSFTTPTGARNITLPDASGAVCLDSNNCSYAAASGSANYIQNQNAAPQTSANFNIDGTGVAANLNATTGVNTGSGTGTKRIDSSGNLVAIGNLTATAAITIASTGASNDIILNSADTIELQDATNVTGTFSASGIITASALGTASNAAYLCRNGSNQIAACNTTGAGVAFIQGGNTLGAAGDLGTNDAFDLNLRTGGATRVTIASDGSQVLLSSNTDLLLQGATAYISNPQAQTASESFGLNASVTGSNALAVGNGASAAGNSIAIGTSAAAAGTGRIAIGRSATTTADFQLVVGGSTANSSYITDAYLGSGVTDTSPQNIVLHGTGGSGSNVAGASVTLAGGQSTGSANGGGINFQISAPSGGGSSLNALGTVASISGASGAVSLQNAVNTTSAFQVQNAAGTQLLNISTIHNTNDLIANGNVEQNTTGWAAKGSSSISRTTSQQYIGVASLQVDNTANGDGAKYNVTLASSTQYTVQFWAKLASSTFTNMSFGYASDGSTETDCKTNQSVKTTGWMVFNCTFTTGTISGTPYFYWKQNTAVSRTVYVDALQIVPGPDVGVYYEGKINVSGLNFSGPVAIQNDSDSQAAFQIQSASGTTVMGVDSINERVGINLIQPTATFHVVTIGTTSVTALFNQNNTSTQDILQLAKGAVNTLSVTSTGIVTSQNLSDSTAAFRILKSSGTFGTGSSLFNVDTTNSRITIGPGDTTGALLILDSKTNAGDPTGVAGGMYYNANAAKFRCYENGSWKNCLGKNINLTFNGTNGNGAASQWSNMPAALTELFGLTNSRNQYDLTDATQVRLQVNVNGAGVSGSKLRAQYSTDQSTWNYLDGGTGPSVNVDATGLTVSSWVNVDAGAKSDVYLRIIGISGDGAADPTFGLIQLQVR